MSYSIHKHLTFNTWATAQLARVLREVDDEIYFRENNSSHSSMAKTILHMWGAQVIWLVRMKGENPGSFPVSIHADNKLRTIDQLVSSAEELEHFIASKDDAFLSSEYAYKNLKGEPFTDSIADTIFHIVNHNTYHRGQVITMMRQAGITNVVSTDLIHYLRSVKK